MACIAVQISKDLRRITSTEEALRLSGQANCIVRELLQESPNDCGLLDISSQSWNEIAKGRWDLHQTEAALTACRNALEAQRRVFALAPEAPSSRGGLDWRFVQLGRKLCELGRLDEAEACFRESQKLWPDPARQAQVLHELRKWAASSARTACRRAKSRSGSVTLRYTRAWSGSDAARPCHPLPRDSASPRNPSPACVPMRHQ